MKVAINADLKFDGTAGGVEQFLLCLIRSLGQLDDGPEMYFIIANEQGKVFLQKYLCSNQRIISKMPSTVSNKSMLEKSKRILGPLRLPMGWIWRRIKNFALKNSSLVLSEVPISNGFYERLEVDVIHFPYQQFVHCSLPIIYNPHDLQHLHYPHFFDKKILDWRNTIYPAGCHGSSAIAAESVWCKNDIVRQYNIDPNKIFVIPRGSPTEFDEPITEKFQKDIRCKFRLPQKFSLYPAQTWAHKNHKMLLEAFYLLRERNDLKLNLVCTGKKSEFWSEINQHIKNLRLKNQVQFLDFVHRTELRALYRMAKFVVFPSLFEGGGFPVIEGFSEGTPVTCSHVTSLSEYGGDAVLFFDPNSVESIAEAVRSLAADAKLREHLRQKGYERIRVFSWRKTAKTYRAIYRKVGGQELSEEDLQLLESNTNRIEHLKYISNQ